MFKIDFKNKIYSNRGFTLIETFVAIVVLMIAVLGPMSLLSRALQDSRYIRDEIIGSYLSQEGIELVIDCRNRGCPDLEDGELSSPYSCSQFYLEESTGYYNCNLAGISTLLSRTVKLTEVGDSQYKIISEVKIAGRSRSITAESTIFSP